MASFHLPISTTLSSASSLFFSPSNTISRSIYNQKRLKKSLSCRAAKGNEQEEADHVKYSSSISINPSPTSGLNTQGRRDVLFGLTATGLYGGTAFQDPAFALPVVTPNKCRPAVPCDGPKEYCCPPFDSNIKDFEPESLCRVRPAAHLLHPEYIQKYMKAVKKMKELPPEDPRNFHQQANVHCAYCDGAYGILGMPPELKLNVHSSSLFFPFHRLFLYFHEKILGDLIDDPTFALPYWNWDSHIGMKIPEIYKDRSGSAALYDKQRDSDHVGEDVILNYKEGQPMLPHDLIWKRNWALMHKQMFRSKTPHRFFGCDYFAGFPIPDPTSKCCTYGKTAGLIETTPHNNVHNWVGDRKEKGVDMGIFRTAARDPIFYAHHANVDRMWNIWKILPGKNRKDIDNTNWLDSSFLFYNEKKELVQVRVRDCLDSEKQLGYKYQEVPIEWLTRPPSLELKNNISRRKREVKTETNPVYPIVLQQDKLVKIMVPRESKSRMVQQKEEEEELLEIYGINFDGTKSVSFDVYITDADEIINGGPEYKEFAGTFANVPNTNNPQITTGLSLGLTDLLEDLGMDDEDSVTVALVSTSENEITIDGLNIITSSY